MAQYRIVPPVVLDQCLRTAPSQPTGRVRPVPPRNRERIREVIPGLFPSVSPTPVKRGRKTPVREPVVTIPPAPWRFPLDPSGASVELMGLVTSAGTKGGRFIRREDAPQMTSLRSGSLPSKPRGARWLKRCGAARSIVRLPGNRVSGPRLPSDAWRL